MGIRFDVVCFSHLRWGFVYQRPQHLLSRCARNHRVFYVEEPIEGDKPGLKIERWENDVTTIVPLLPEGLSESQQIEIQRGLLDDFFEEHKIERLVLWYYTPMAVPLGRHLRPLVTVYDCMDELSAFSGAPKALRDREGELFDSADLLFTGGASLYAAKRDRHQSVHLFPSSVDVQHFAQARQPLPDPGDQALIRHPRLGYIGVIDERFDPALLGELAASRPDWQFVMIGPVLKIDSGGLPTAPNIHWLGQKRYEDLPAYLSGWDVALMPFARNESTRFISPTKTPEYLAAGRPVVSTPITDVVEPYERLGLVRIAEDAAGFAAAAEAAMAEDASRRQRQADAFLKDRSWDRTWSEMEALIARTAARRSDNGSTVHVRLLDDANAVSAISESMPVPTNGAKGFDYLVVGAGYAGSVIARELAEQGGSRVLVVDRRNHIGGNAYDEYDEYGIQVHRYGPHIFHTNSQEVFEYLSRFTAWRPYEHRVLASVDGRLVPIPINLDTINEIYGLRLSSFEVEKFFASRAEPVEKVRTSEDVVVTKVGRELYEKFFRGYTRKQWGLDPSELDAKVTSRVPVRTNRDPRYFTDTYQAMPRDGYTRMFQRILDHPRIKLMLNTDYREIASFMPYKEVVYTGPIDEFFDHRLGQLPYRSLEFRFETIETNVAQPAPVINYPNERPYTRVTEFKYLTGQVHPKTTLVYEYPRAEGDPYYPVPRPENEVLYKRYQKLADVVDGVHFVGRLATYRYYNMDQVVAQALAVSRRLIAARRAGKEGPLEVDPTQTSARTVGRA
ncbi:MAG TPA: UDP-galactopyranose mutase [Actinomycetota bacterium]|nr:UDP-galactopyranose mutase [Actinomycetota bacterium]